MGERPEAQRAVIVRWDGKMPPELRDSVRELVTDYLWLLPWWVRKLYVAWAPDHQDAQPDATGTGTPAVASADSQTEYRVAVLTLHAHYLDRSPVQRRRTVIHELMHQQLEPAVQEHDRQLEVLFTDHGLELPKILSRTFARQWQLAYEGCVQDLTWMVAQLAREALPRVPWVDEVDVQDDWP